MIKDLTTEQKDLMDFMSDISERCYYAGWMRNLEYILWDTLTSGPRTYGHDTITQSDINKIKELFDKAKSWVFFHDDTEETGIAISQWTHKFQTRIEADSRILKG